MKRKNGNYDKYYYCRANLKNNITPYIFTVVTSKRKTEQDALFLAEWHLETNYKNYTNLEFFRVSKAELLDLMCINLHEHCNH